MAKLGRRRVRRRRRWRRWRSWGRSAAVSLASWLRHVLADAALQKFWRLSREIYSGRLNADSRRCSTSLCSLMEGSRLNGSLDGLVSRNVMHSPVINSWIQVLMVHEGSQDTLCNSSVCEIASVGTHSHFIPMLLESLKLREDELKEEVRKVIKGTNNALQTLELIDIIQRLGVAYHFEDEINCKLNEIHNKGFESNDLYAIALHFRLLRQHRYHISCDVFERFLNDEKEFMASFESNIKTILCLYEAAHLYMPGEEILDKAKKFTESLLIDASLSELELHLAMMVTSSLDYPLIRRVNRPMAKLYLSIHESESGYNKVLLKFAKLDFIILQALYRDEVRSLSMWWKNSGFTENLSFSRDRIVEHYFWALAMYHEPCYSRARIMTTKLIALITLTDDIYDTYGTVEELILLTDVIQSWELGSVNKLPKYMQQYFLAFYHTFQEFEEELAEENYSFRVKYTIEELKMMVQGYLKEAKWSSEFYVPELKEHFEASLVTVGYTYASCGAMIGLKDVVTDDYFQWVYSKPPFMMSSSLIGRIMNDIVSYEFEQSRKHVASTVQCYMKEHKCSEEEACEKLMEMVEEAWKVINKEFMFSKNIPMALFRILVSFTNFNNLVYKDRDHFTNSNLSMKDHITAVLVEPVQIDLQV